MQAAGALHSRTIENSIAAANRAKARRLLRIHPTSIIITAIRVMEAAKKVKIQNSVPNRLLKNSFFRMEDDHWG